VRGIPGSFGFLGYLSWDLGLHFRVCSAGFGSLLDCFMVLSGCKVSSCIDDYYRQMELFGRWLSLWQQPLWQMPSDSSYSDSSHSGRSSLPQKLSDSSYSDSSFSDSSHSDRSPLTAALWQQLWQRPDNWSDNDYPTSLPWTCSANKKSSSFNNAKSLLVTALEAYRPGSTLQSRWQ